MFKRNLVSLDNFSSFKTKKEFIEYLKKFNINLQSIYFINALKKLKEENLIKIMRLIDHYYYNVGDPVITDMQYDNLFEFIGKKYPKSVYARKIGSPIENKEKVKLPFTLPSLNSCNDDHKLQLWSKNYSESFIISDKHDGVSLLIADSLYSRGDGEYGQNINNLKKYLNIPKTDYIIRAELTIKISVFKKYHSNFSSARSLIAGMINKKDINKKILEHIDIIAYEIIYPVMKPSEQLRKLKELGFKVPEYKLINFLNFEELSSYLHNQKNKIDYDIDGLVITQNMMYKRSKLNVNPKYSVKFKPMSINKAYTTTVKDVIWTPSKHGFLKPVITLNPVIINGTKISKATGFNAFFIKHGYKKGEIGKIKPIGKGAIVSLIRSGDVIPHINKVIKGSKHLNFPKVSYYWSKSKINIILNDKNNSIVNIKKIVNFFKTLGTKHISIGIIKKLYTQGFDNVFKICKITKKQLLNIEGIKNTLADKLLKEINVVNSEILLSKLMLSSGCFSNILGKLRLQKICEELPNVLELNNEQIKQKLIKLNGFGYKIVIEFLKNLTDFKVFIKKYKFNINNTIKYTSNLLKGDTICFTGIRDKQLEIVIKNNNGKIANSITKNTTILITKNKNHKSPKVTKAEKLDIKILTITEFIKKYNL